MKRFQSKKQLKVISVILSALTPFVVSEVAFSAPKTEVQKYVKCYQQLTDREPDPASANYLKVVNRQMTAIAACVSLLNRVKLISGAVTATDVEAVAVLNKFNNIHNSWFVNRDYIEDISSEMLLMKHQVFDPTGPALHITRALFTDGVPYGNIFIGGGNYHAVRNGAETILVDYNRTIFSKSAASIPRVKSGDLIGIQHKSTFVLDYDYLPAATATVPAPTALTGSIDIAKHFGGGILGSPAYLQTTIVPPRYVLRGAAGYVPFTAERYDGGVKVPRRFGKSVVSDFLCKDLPAALVSDADATKFVDPSSSVPFRTDRACAVCHATMDQLTGVVRHIGYVPVAEPIFNNNRGGFTPLHPVYSGQKPASAAYWDFGPDLDYANRPATGRLFYRTSENALIDVKVDSLEHLGAVMATQKDAYRCVAKRYYEHFVGVKVPMSFTPADVSQDRHKAAIYDLAEKFKISGSLKELVSDILESENYINR
ncbi:MAG: hypothetical protein NT027_08660 [Proteobacteria bacterium]|nr:hypothetical protein [Pseudomonadota bacterium]